MKSLDKLTVQQLSSAMLENQPSYTRPREKSYSISSDWAKVIYKVEEKKYRSRNTLETLDNYFHDGYKEFDKLPQKFCTGSQYEGSWNVVGFSGYGRYIFPHGPIYEGDFENGLFHGQGKIIYSKGNTNKTIVAQFEKGDIIEDSIYFQIGLKEINPKSFDYCKMPDRRFAIELCLENLLPVGSEYLTNSDEVRPLVSQIFDVGNGLFDGRRNIIIEDEQEDESTGRPRISIPNAKKELWIRNNCRQAKSYPVGFRPDFYEHWLAGRKRERLKYGFLPDLSEKKESVESEETEETFELTEEDEEEEEEDSLISLSILEPAGDLESIINDIHNLLENRGFLDVTTCKDSTSDTKAATYIESIIDYLEKQYYELKETEEAEETEEIEYVEQYASDIFMDDIVRYLKSVKEDTEVPQPKFHKPRNLQFHTKYRIPKENLILPEDDEDLALSDVDYSLEDLGLTNDFDESDEGTLGKNESNEQNEEDEEEENEEEIAKEKEEEEDTENI